MSRNKKLINRIIAIVLIVFGVVFGGTWNSTQLCLGDRIFSALGLPAWSNKECGTHYPAIVGVVFILIGISVLNTTLSKKARLWVWTITILVLVIINLGFTYL